MADIDKTVVINQDGDAAGKDLCPVCGYELQPDPADVSSLRCPACSYKKKQTFTLMPGEVIGNKYKLLSYLNGGGGGDLFLCCPLDDMGKRNVLKVMKNRDSASSVRFEREATILFSIRNERIATVLDYWKAGDECFIIMEYIKGNNLRELKDIYSIDEQTALQIIQEAALALQYIWENYSIIHRDIKPENIMLNDEYQVKLLDFGLSKRIGDDAMTDITLDHVGIGTPGYMSPEQFVDSKNVDYKADIYSLGATLFFLITDEKPISGKSNQEIYKNTIQNSPPPISKMEKYCSPGCMDLICSMMAAKPNDRPAYGELLKKIEALIG